MPFLFSFDPPDRKCFCFVVGTAVSCLYIFFFESPFVLLYFVFVFLNEVRSALKYILPTHNIPYPQGDSGGQW